MPSAIAANFRQRDIVRLGTDMAGDTGKTKRRIGEITSLLKGKKKKSQTNGSSLRAKLVN